MYAKSAQNEANYDLEKHVSRNFLGQCHLELCDFAIVIYCIILCAWSFLPIRFTF